MMKRPTGVGLLNFKGDSLGYEKVGKRLLEYGVLAPSIYNSQPWKFTLDAARGVIGVYPDEERGRPRDIDHDQREVYFALGACVENMVLAAPAMGYELKEVLFPRGTEGPAALLALKPIPEAVPESLFGTLLTRQTHAGKYKEGSVQPLHLERLRHLPAFSPEEKMAFLTEPGELKKLVSLLHDAAHAGAGDPRLVEEGARWAASPEGAFDGLSMEMIGLPISAKSRFSFLRFFGRHREVEEVARQTLLRQGHGIEAPGFLLITGKARDRKSYFNAGRWLTRIQLTLSEMELGSQALFLPVALKDFRSRLLECFKVPEGAQPLLLLRFGQPLEKAWPKTARRPVESALSAVL